MIKLEFETEETMKTYFKAEYKKVISRCNRPQAEENPNDKRVVDETHTAPIDLKDREFSRGGRSYSIRRYALTRAELFREWEMQQQQIGRYPVGFRHYENYVNYRNIFPDASIEDYMKDMNRECSFAEFLNVMKAFMTQTTRHNRFRFKFRIRKRDRNPVADLERKKRIDQIVTAYLASPKFEQAAQEKFRKLQYSKMVDKKIFTLVDCLEEVMDLWSYGPNFWDLPTHNLFIPTKTTLMMKPKFIEAEDELGWRLIDRNDKKTTTPKIDPTAPLNPLKGIKLMPNNLMRDAFEKKYVMHKPFFKLRRLSEMKPGFGAARYKIHRLFSTQTRDPVQQVNPFRHFFASQELNASPFRQ